MDAELVKQNVAREEHTSPSNEFLPLVSDQHDDFAHPAQTMIRVHDGSDDDSARPNKKRNIHVASENSPCPYAYAV